MSLRTPGRANQTVARFLPASAGVRLPFLLLVLLLLLLLSSCSDRVELPEGGISRGEYLTGLGEAGILNSEIAERWRAQATRELETAEAVEIPFNRSWTVRETAARSFAFAGVERERVLVRASISEGEGSVFVDLYEVEGERRRLLFSTNGGEGSFVSKRGARYLLLAQPEIYAYGSALVSVERADSRSSEEDAAMILSPGTSRRP